MSRQSGLGIPIVMVSDELFTMPLATAVCSIAAIHDDLWPLDVHILSAGINRETRQRVETSVPFGSIRFHWLPLEVGRFSAFPSRTYPSATIFGRMLVPELMPEDVRRVLYLDSDVLVLGRIDSLATMPLTGNPVAAVSDQFLSSRIRQSGQTAELRGLHRYFNSGVLVMDLAVWRAEKIADVACRYLSENPHTLYPDQDALNVACGGRWEELDESWNFQGHVHVDVATLSPAARPRIVHFIGPQKPWLPGTCNPNRKIYDSFRRQTQFSMSPRERCDDLVRRNLRRISSRLVPDRRRLQRFVLSRKQQASEMRW